MSAQGYSRFERILARNGNVNHSDLVNIENAIAAGAGTGATEATLAAVLAELQSQGRLDFESFVVEDAVGDKFEYRITVNEDDGTVTRAFYNADGTSATPVDPISFVASNISNLATEATLVAVDAVLDNIKLDTANLDVALSTRATEATLTAVNTTLDDTANQIVKVVDTIEVNEDGTPTGATGIFKNVEFYRVFNRETGAVVTNINATGGSYTVVGTVNVPPVLMGDVIEYTDGTDTYLAQHYSDGTIISTLIGGTTVKYGIPSGFSRTGVTTFTSVSNTVAANLAAGYKAVLFDFAGLDTHTATVNGEVFTKSSPALVLNYGESNRLSPQISYVVSDAAAVLKIKTIA